MAVNQFYDETAGHEIVQAPMGEARPFLRSALLGAYVELISMTQRAAVAAADAGRADQHVDGLVSRGDIVAIEPWATDDLIDSLVAYRYLEPAAQGGFRLKQHEKLANWEPAEMLAWRKLRRKDTRDPVLRRLVRFRDGDQCRVCGTVVHWRNNTDDDSGTLDHIVPRVPANGDPEALAVACRRCNGIRSDRADANEFAPHRPVPEHPYFTETTAKYLRDAGMTMPDGKPIRKTGEKWLLPLLEISARPAPKADPAANSDPATSGTPHPQKHPQEALNGPLGRARPGTGPDTATTPARPASQADTAQRDPAPSGTPRSSETRVEFGRSSPETRETNSPPDPAPPRTNPPQIMGGLPGGEGKGEGVAGSGDGPRRRGTRGRRARRSQPRSVNRADRQE